MMLHNGNPSRVGRNILPAGDFCCVGKSYLGTIVCEIRRCRPFPQADCNKDWTCDWTEKMNAVALTVGVGFL